MSRRKKKGSNHKGYDLKKLILEFFDANPGKQYNIKQLAFKLGMNGKKERQALNDVVEFLVQNEMLAEPYPWKYSGIPRVQKSIEGIIEITRYGYGFVSNPESGIDVFIPPKQTGLAFNGDKVRVLLHQNSRGKKTEGRVVEILERRRNEFVGIVEVSRQFAFFKPDNQKVHVDFYISLTKLNGAQNGDKVIVEMTDWPEGSKNPFGRVVRILGKSGEHDVEMHAIMEEYGLPYHFSEEAVKEADLLPVSIPDEEIARRRDFRDIFTFTIDPADAKDFDDAISFRKIGRNRYELGVHIADVSWYVKPGSLLDKEGFSRATSVYLVDRVVPMLPENLSNHLCSLRADEDKLCFAAVFEMDSEAKILKEWFGRTIIKSRRRFSYDEVQEILEKKVGEFSHELMEVNKLAARLREQRYADGSFSFETEEVKFRLDDQGKPLGLTKLVRKEAHMMIEDLMLLANKRVATVVAESARKYPMIYRVHDAPNEEKLSNFSRMALQFGYTIDRTDDRHLAQSFNTLLKNTEGKPEQNFLQTLAIRAMAKATYSPKNIGHYGLAFDFYTHFTSPIRRYPDILAHRILDDFLSEREPKYSAEQLTMLCKYTSEREQNAEQAERASVKYKQVEFMMDKIGQEFDGVISGVIESGIFVEITENKCEGFVPAGKLEDDIYIYDEENFRFKAFHGNKVYRLGQQVRIVVTDANLNKRTLDFNFV